MSWFKWRSKYLLIVDVDADKLEPLFIKSGCKTKKELLNAALTLYEWAIDKRNTGQEIAAVNEKAESWTPVKLSNWEELK